MPSSKYLLRFDDICPTMNWEVWAQIEKVLIENEVKPILAVVPDNRDPNLMVDPPREDFWEKVREWQARGWTIALHGWQHIYVNRNAGLIGVTKNSEFAAVPREEQRRKLESGLEVFKEQGVRAECWVAPSHSFDRTTLSLLSELGVNVVSDGLWRWPHVDKAGMTWVPQQLWRLYKVTEPGIWTVCNHHNSWTPDQLREFAEQVGKQKDDFIGLDDILSGPVRSGISLSDRKSAAWELFWIHRLSNRLMKLKHLIKRKLLRQRGN